MDKDFDEYEKDYLKRYEEERKKREVEDEIRKSKNPESDPSKKYSNYKASSDKFPKALGIAMAIAIPLIIGVIAGAVMAATSEPTVYYNNPGYQQLNTWSP
tara:strand:- start:64 stop:366 length:303 start_codon:yes stop_codon:yes gene_type:complete